MDPVEYKRIESKQDYNEWIKYEDALYAHGGVIRYRLLYLLQASERVVLHRHMRLLRKAEYHTNCGHTIRAALCQFRLNKFQNKYALHIPINTCGKGLRLMHLGPILLNDQTRLGENCVLHINAAFVSGSHQEGAPKLGNYVLVFTGVTVAGGISIADRIQIGANAFVNRTFEEENIVLAGVPARKIKMREE